MSRLIEIAQSAVGLTQDDAALQALCGPGETPGRARELSRLSTCALFLRGCLAFACAEVGGPHDAVPPRLWAPYVIGNAMADLVYTCEKTTAHDRLEAHLSNVRPGAIVIVGDSGHEHAYLVERIERDGWPDGSIELTAIEAGQVDKQGRQCVRRKRHEIDARGVDLTWGWPLPGGDLRDTVPLPQNGSPALRRPVTWVLDTRALMGK